MQPCTGQVVKYYRFFKFLMRKSVRQKPHLVQQCEFELEPIACLKSQTAIVRNIVSLVQKTMSAQWHY